MQSKCLFEFFNKIFILIDLYFKTYKLALNGESNAI
jgi:hypothetical protein